MNTQWLKSAIKAVTPPILVTFINHLRSQTRQPEWEYIPAGWRAATKDAAIKGWAQKSVLDAYISRWQTFLDELNGTQPFGISPEITNQSRVNLAFHNVIMSYAYALSVAAAGKSRLSMLDWGGGIGHYYLISKTLRADLKFDYTCKDFALFTQYGQNLFPEAKFVSGNEWKRQSYDFVLASSSLQYSEVWRTTFRELAQVTTGYLFITRLPVIHHRPSYVMVQRPYRYGYNTEYLGWCLNRQEILESAKQGELTLIREFIVENAPYIHNAPEQCDYWGFLFQKRSSANGS